MLEIKNLTVKVKNNTPILTDVSLSIDEGTCIGLGLVALEKQL